MDQSKPRWPDLEFIRDEGSFEDAAAHDVSGWELIIFELEDDEQPAPLPR